MNKIQPNKLDSKDYMPNHTPKLFSRAGAVALIIGLVGLFLILQQIGVYLFAPYVLNDPSLTPLQRVDRGGIGINGTVISYSMSLTFVGIVTITYLIVKLRLNHLRSEYHPIGENLKVRDYLAIRSFPLHIGVGVMGLWLLFIIASESATYMLDQDPTEFVDALYYSADPKWLLILTMVVTAPIYEEIIFRGILWSAIKEQFADKKGVWIATIITSLIFAVIHLQYDLYEMSTIFILSLLLGFARAKSRSLLLPIFIHILNNAVAMWLYLIVN